MIVTVAWAAAAIATVVLARRLHTRLLLSRAKHPSLLGHARLAKRVARLMPAFSYSEERFFTSDGAPPDVADLRRTGFDRLSQRLTTRAPATLDATARLEQHVSDLQFTKQYSVPFPYREVVARHLRVGSLVRASAGVLVENLDDGWDYDLAG